MIAKVITPWGWDGQRLVRYLMSQGRFNEHTRPTVVAAWQGDPDALQPERDGPGDFDFAPGEIGKLAQHFTAASDAAGLPAEQPEPGEPGYTKNGYIWHCPIAIEAEDGQLDFKTWRMIAEDLMNETGIGAYGDTGGCRWIAVHHGLSGDPRSGKPRKDHIHVAAVLVRQDDGKRVWPRDDWAAARRVARRWEDALGLRKTPMKDRSAAPTPSRGENEKASRRAAKGDAGLSRGEAGAAARVQLRQVITEAAAITTSAEEFLERLRGQGVLVQLRHNNVGEVVGWAVAAPGDVSARTGKPIFFAPSRDLAAELSWPKITARWTAAGDAGAVAAQRTDSATAERRKASDVLTEGADRVRGVTRAVRDGADVEPVAREMQDLLASWAAAAEGAERRGRVSRALWVYDRAARNRRGLPATPATIVAAEIRTVSRELTALAVLSGRASQRDATLALTLATVELLLEIAAWHQQARRAAPALAASRAASQLQRHAADLGHVADLDQPGAGRTRTEPELVAAAAHVGDERTLPPVPERAALEHADPRRRALNPPRKER